MKLSQLTAICLAAVITLFMSCQKENNTAKNTASDNTASNGRIGELPVDSSLIAWYDFNHGSLEDKSIYGNNIIACVAKKVPGKNGRDNGAYSFNGRTSYMRIANSPSLNPGKGITLAVLIQPNGFYQGTCHGNRILSKGYENANGNYYLGFDDERFYDYDGCSKPVKERKEQFYGFHGNAGLISLPGRPLDSNYIRPGKWYYLVYTNDGSVQKLYQNSVLVDSVVGNTLTYYQGHSEDVFIGKSINIHYPYFFNGVIDEVRIYNRALSSAEVTGLNTLMGK